MSARQLPSTTRGPSVPYYVEGPKREAAKWLRIEAHRFLRGASTVEQLTEAARNWLSVAAPPLGQSPPEGV